MHLKPSENIYVFEYHIRTHDNSLHVLCLHMCHVWQGKKSAGSEEQEQ
jgi:hypothetical protein